MLTNSLYNLSTHKEREKAILVCTTIPKHSASRIYKQKAYKEHLEELELLTLTAGARVIGKFYQERDSIDPAFFIGKGKAFEIAEMVEAEKADIVVFENTLSPTQIRNLEKVIKCKIIDKPALILDIFATHARTAEAKTQVELAQLQYIQARLTRAWTHFSKQAGGIGTRGPGETQIETDRRLIASRISMLKYKLRKIEEQRKIQRQLRDNFTRIALVGYTNAGKSTLLNCLTNAGVYVEDKLFATLDTSTRILKTMNGRRLPVPVLISDTVGFIKNLPHDLIESFKSTLAEVSEADILLHVVDISSENYTEQIRIVEETLKELSVIDKTIIMVFNKVDKLNLDEQREKLRVARSEYIDSVFISAEKGLNIDHLYNKIVAAANDVIMETEIEIPNSNDSYKILNRLYSVADVKSVKYFSRFIRVNVRGNKNYLHKILSSSRKFKKSNIKKEKVCQ